ncbi:hypothetical protein DPMN_054966 [Dreissena polymorpha]|uniref:Uncharacterized protein n=1 Tax=Dreissena polymorpha TaxID=45954 RepID=A0A9D4CP36_DREPO|nr:hypothetical protein DPMN_054966 [Dreissena polymorpha]
MKTHAVIILLLTLLCAIAVRSTVDVESKLADLDAKMLQFEAKTVQLEDKNTKLDSKNVQLEATIGKLAAKIEQLEKERNADKEIRKEKDVTSALRLNNHNGTGAMQKIPFGFIKSPHTRGKAPFLYSFNMMFEESFHDQIIIQYPL